MDTTNMDSPLFYDMPNSSCIKLNKQEPKLSPNEDSLPDISELDPSFESTQNIQELIDREGILFPELFTSGPEFPVLDQQGSSCAVVDFNQHIEDIAHMTVVCDSDPQVTENKDDSTSDILVIRPEDLASLGVTLSGELELLPQPEPKVEVGDLLEEDFSQLSVDRYSFTTDSTSSSVVLPKLKGSKRSRGLDKNSEEYRAKRQKNNIAVRKSRDKAKIHQHETEGKVKLLTNENEKLQKKVDLLTKELAVLKGLFTNVGAKVPARLAALLE